MENGISQRENRADLEVHKNEVFKENPKVKKNKRQNGKWKSLNEQSVSPSYDSLRMRR